MPRIRTIKPQFWLDEKLGNISRDARLLYIGLWNLSDDQGVFEYRPSRIKAQLFPYDVDITGENIASWLDILTQTGDIVKFSTNGKDFGYILTFLNHQEIKNPSKWRFSELPPELTNSTPVLPQPYGSPTRREKEKEKEKESIGEKRGENRQDTKQPGVRAKRVKNSIGPPLHH